MTIRAAIGAVLRSNSKTSVREDGIDDIAKVLRPLRWGVRGELVASSTYRNGKGNSG